MVFHKTFYPLITIFNTTFILMLLCFSSTFLERSTERLGNCDCYKKKAVKNVAKLFRVFYC